MPLQDWNLKATFDASYVDREHGHPNTRPGVLIHYHLGVLGNSVDRIAAYFDSYLGPAAYNNSFVIVGGGFGWIAGALLDRGFTNIVVTETSDYILAEMDNSDEQEVRDACSVAGLDPNGARADELVALWARPGVPRRRRKGAAEDVPIIDADISTPQGRSAAKTAVGGNPQIVVTEDVMAGLSDAEAIALDGDCQAWGGQQTVVHLVTTLAPGRAQDAAYNWKTLAQWKALIPSAIWIDAVTGEVLE